MISSEEFLQFCDEALDAYADILRDLGDDLVCVRPDLPGANTPFGLTAHVVGVMGFWARTTNRGVVVPRDRAGEFLAAGTVEQALALLAIGRARLHEDVAATGDGREPPRNPPTDQPEVERLTQGALLLHVYEEMAQHLGQLEIIRDALLAATRRACP